MFADETGGSDRWPVWDEAVVAIILDLTTWRELPRPTLRDDLSFSFPNVRSRAPFRWVVAMDRERVFGDLADLLTHLSSKARGQSAAIARRPREKSLQHFRLKSRQAGCSAMPATPTQADELGQFASGIPA